MSTTVAFISQKGGVGKSTLARALAVVTAKSGLKVKVADLDHQQRTLFEWFRRRQDAGLELSFDVERYDRAEDALLASDECDLFIIDMPGRASRATREVARMSHLVVQPTGASIDDLRPGILLFHELAATGIPKSQLVFAICRTLTKTEEDAARDYIEAAGYQALAGAMPERATSRDAQNQGRSVVEGSDQSLVKRVDELLGDLIARMVAEVQALDALKTKMNTTGAV